MTDPDTVVERPKINPAFVPVVVDHDTVQFRAGPWNGPVYTVADEDGDGHLAPLVGDLDGTNTVADLIERYPGDADDVWSLVAHLVEENLVFDASTTDAVVRDDLRGHVSLQRGFDEADVERARSASVVVCNATSIADVVVDELVDLGIDDVQVVDVPGDAGESPPVGQREFDAVAVEPNDLRALLEAADVAVYTADRPGPQSVRLVNRLTQETGTPWIAGQVQGVDGMVGPTVLPGETACYRCFERRSTANAADPDALERYRESSGPLSFPPGLDHVIAGLLVSETVRQLSAGTGFSVGRVLHVDGLDLSIEANDLLSVPRCSVCGTFGEPTYQRFVTLDDLVADRGGGAD